MFKEVSWKVSKHCIVYVPIPQLGIPGQQFLKAAKS